MDDEDSDEEDLENMDPSQLLTVISQAFEQQHGRPPTEEEAAAFLEMIDGAPR